MLTISSVILLAYYPSDAINKTINGIAIMAFVYTTPFLFLAVIITLPKPSRRGWGTAIPTGFTLVVNTWVALFFVILQFVPQYLEMRRLSGATRSAQPSISLPTGCGNISRRDKMAVEAGSTNMDRAFGTLVGSSAMLVPMGSSVLQLSHTWAWMRSASRYVFCQA